MDIKENEGLVEWNTSECLLWLNNEERLYESAKQVSSVREMRAFWRYNKPIGAKTKSKYIDFERVFREFNEE